MSGKGKWQSLVNTPTEGRCPLHLLPPPWNATQLQVTELGHIGILAMGKLAYHRARNWRAGISGGTGSQPQTCRPYRECFLTLLSKQSQPASFWEMRGQLEAPRIHSLSGEQRPVSSPFTRHIGLSSWPHVGRAVGTGKGAGLTLVLRHIVECWLQGGVEENGLNMAKMSSLGAVSFHSAVHTGVRQLHPGMSQGSGGGGGRRVCEEDTRGNSEAVEVRIPG